MLGLLRKYSQSVIIYVLFGIIIIVFVFTFNMGELAILVVDRLVALQLLSWLSWMAKILILRCFTWGWR